MKLIVLCVLVAYAAATGSHTGHHDHDPFSEVPECRAVQEAGYDIPSCEGLSTCLREVHTKAHACTMKELKDKKMRTCHGTDEVKTARNAFFKYSCKWHAAFSKCMSGESPAGFSATRKRRTATHNQGQYFSGKNGECWKDVFAKVAQCKQIGQECEHYTVCAGETQDEDSNDVQSTWFEITRDLRARKYEKMTDYKTKISTCVQNNQESSEEDS